MKPAVSIMHERAPVRLHPRKAFSAKQRAEILLANGGRCYLSGAKIGAGEAWDVEHIIPLAQGGTNDLSNLKPALRGPHKAKTAKDAADTAKARRRAGETCQGPRKAIPIHVSPWPPKGARKLPTKRHANDNPSPGGDRRG